MPPALRLTTVAVIAPARSEATKAAVSATSASVGSRLSSVLCSSRARNSAGVTPAAAAGRGEVRLDERRLRDRVGAQADHPDAGRADLEGQGARERLDGGPGRCRPPIRGAGIRPGTAVSVTITPEPWALMRRAAAVAVMKLALV